MRMVILNVGAIGGVSVLLVAVLALNMGGLRSVLEATESVSNENLVAAKIPVSEMARAAVLEAAGGSLPKTAKGPRSLDDLTQLSKPSKEAIEKGAFKDQKTALKEIDNRPTASRGGNATLSKNAKNRLKEHGCSFAAEALAKASGSLAGGAAGGGDADDTDLPTDQDIGDLVEADVENKKIRQEEEEQYEKHLSERRELIDQESAKTSAETLVKIAGVLCEVR